MTKPKAGLPTNWRQLLHPKGQPVAQRWPKRTLEQRFMEKVTVDSSSECWVWQAAISRSGYAWFNANGHATHGHTVAYELFVGPIPDGLTLDHLCHTADLSCSGGSSCPHRRCVNPAHLEPITLAENKARGRSPAAENARKTHCQYGHEFTLENTYRPSTGGRHCRACNRLEQQQIKAFAIDAEPERFCQADDCGNRIQRGTRPDKITCSPACRTRLARTERGI